MRLNVLAIMTMGLCVLMVSACSSPEDKETIKGLKAAKRALEERVATLSHDVEEQRAQAASSQVIAEQHKTLRNDLEKYKQLLGDKEKQSDACQRAQDDLQNQIGKLSKKYATIQNTLKARGQAVLNPGETTILHYWRRDGRYSDWGLHVWGPAIKIATNWEQPILFSQTDAFGGYAEVQLHPEDSFTFPLKFLIHKGPEKDFSINRGFLAAENPEVWLVEGESEIYTVLDRAEAAKAKALAQSGPSAP